MSNQPGRIHIKYTLGLLIAALFWGMSYPATKLVQDYPTFYVVSIRFIAATVALGLIFHRKFRLFNRDVLKYSFLLSSFITLMYVFSTLGIKYTTSARASFFTCLTFVIVPLLNLLLFRIRMGGIIIRSIIICFVGVFLLSFSSGSGGSGINLGDFLCILASVCGSFHIILVDKVSKIKTVDNTLFTVFLMGFVALWSTVIELSTGAFQEAQLTVPAFADLLFLGLFCSGAAYLLQTICQEYVPANRTGIIFAMEPASGCILSVLFLKESMGAAGWTGAVIIMASLLYMEIAGSRAASD